MTFGPSFVSTGTERRAEPTVDQYRIGLLGRRAVRAWQPCGFRELLARVDERRDSVRDDLEWAKKNDDDQWSYRALERSDIPDAAEASELFPGSGGCRRPEGREAGPLSFSVSKA
jgi:hypothetical protein